MTSIIRDLTFALRLLRRQPGTTLLVLAMLVLGVAGTVAVFTVFNALFLRPLPYRDADRLVYLDERAPQWNLEYVGISYPDFDAWRRDNRSFEGMAAFDVDSLNLFRDGRARRIEASKVTHDMLRVLGVPPLLGRDFTPQEDAPGGPRATLIGHALWQSEFGGDPEILGETILLDSRPYTVVGVLSPDATLLDGTDLWVPLALSADESRGSWFLSGVGRLREGVEQEAASADLLRIHRSLADEEPSNEITSPLVMPLLERVLGPFRLGSRALLAAVMVVLLMACANIAALLLARAASRAREMGIRLAMGAARSRLARQLLTESLLLAVAGGILGSVLGFAVLRLLAANAPEELPPFVRFDLDLRVVAFIGGVVTLATLASGLAPALQTSRSGLVQALRGGGGRSSASGARKRTLSVLVVAQMALALVLLINSGLFLRAFGSLLDVDPGFRSDHLLTYRISLPEATYEERPRRIAFFDAHLADAAGLPGVLAATAATALPLGGHWGQFFEVEGAPPRSEEEGNPVVLFRAVSAEYFSAMGVRLLAGRFFDPGEDAHDVAETPRHRKPGPVVVNETFVRTFLGEGVDIVGRRIRSGADDAAWLTVVGVARDVKHYGLDQPSRPGIYFPFSRVAPGSAAVVLRTDVEPQSLARQIHDLIRAQDPEVPVFDVATMEGRLAESLWSRRATSWVLALFAGVALVLAVGGLYGVAAYAVSQRRQEISIRMALGARREQVLRGVLREGIGLVIPGVALGLVGTVLVASSLRALLFEISPTDPLIYVSVTLLLFVVALLATLIPARRAANVDPIAWLRADS